MAATHTSREARRQWQIDPRTCKVCGETKPLSDYYLHKGRDINGVSKYPQTACKSCAIKREQAKYRANPQKKKKEDKGRILQRVFGITIEQYREMHTRQGSVCAICLGPQQGGKSLCVDHCHKTGKVRGLLCTKCNSAIGKLGDDPLMLQRAIDYLEGYL